MADELEPQVIEPVTPVENPEDSGELAAIEKGLSEAEAENQDEPRRIAPKVPASKESSDIESGKHDKPEAEVVIEKPKSDSDEDFTQTLESIQPKKNAHPNVVNGMKTLKEIAQEERKARKKLEEEFKKTQEELKNARLLTPEMEQQLEEAKLLLKAEKPESDPEIQTKYLSPLNETNSKITQILKDGGAKDTLLAFIEKNGGLAAMAMSTKKMPNEDKTMAEYVEDTILPRIPSAIQRSRLQQLISSAIDLSEAKDKAIEEARRAAPERAKKKEEETTQKFKDAVTAAITELGDDAKEWMVPNDATPEQRKSIETHNERVKKANEAFQQYLKDGNAPDKVAKMMVSAAHSQYLLEVNRELQEQAKAKDEEINKLNDRLNKIKGSGSHARRSNAPPPKTVKEGGKMISDAQAVDEYFKEQDGK